MKKIINSLFMFILGGIIFGSIVYAANYYAKDVMYEPTDASWEVSNVSDALNNLYSIKNELNNTKIELNSTTTTLNNLKGIGDATAAQVLSGKKAVVKGSTITGSMTNRGAWTSTPTGSTKVIIPAGYHNGSGYVDTSAVYNAGYNTSSKKKIQITWHLHYSGVTNIAYPSTGSSQTTTMYYWNGNLYSDSNFTQKLSSFELAQSLTIKYVEYIDATRATDIACYITKISITDI